METLHSRGDVMARTGDDGASGWVVCSFLCGAVVGAALAVLLAPVRGRDIREGVAARVRSGRSRASDAARRGKAVVNRARTHVQEQVDHAARAVDEGRAAWTDVRERGERALEKIRQEVAGAIADAKSARDDVRSEITGDKKD